LGYDVIVLTQWLFAIKPGVFKKKTLPGSGFKLTQKRTAHAKNFADLRRGPMVRAGPGGNCGDSLPLFLNQ
jgi:hypothetical protein